MTQEEKLLLIDLCARLPYGVNVQTKTSGVSPTEGILWSIEDSETGTFIFHKGSTLGYVMGNDIIKPYLRPMSSMTEEEKRHISKMTCLRTYDDGIVYGMTYPVYTSYYVMECCLSYLRSIHVDYYGLIEMGLALEAPADMYKID